ncbi:MAG: sugar porter family MFS transporter [Candidatus Ancaeobacter aquaticus]|nr:sugar porter family MFS transporter [Candidatus Ancaeobacter aquaticus]
MEKVKNKLTPFMFLIAAIAATAGLLFGYDTGVISGAILFITKAFHLTHTVEEFVVSVVLLGAVFGAATSGSVADSLGRRLTILITSILFAIGSIGCASAHNVHLLIAYRFVIGYAIGVASYTAPLYISEISPPHIRGGLVSMNQLMITVGIFLSYIIDYSFSNTEGWRWMLVIGVVPACILFIGMLFLPETPRWLLSRKKNDKASSILKKILNKDNVEPEVEEITASFAKKEGSWKDLFAPWMRPALIVGFMLAFLQQFTGINTVIYYAPTIFQFAGFETAQVAILATAGVGLVNMGMTVVAIWLLDKVGRKPLLYVGMAGMTLSLGVLGLAFKFTALSGALKWIAVGSLVVYVASFAISLGPIFWLMIAEIYPLHIRGRAMSLATLSCWLFNMMVSSTFLTLIDKLGKSGTFWLYAIVAGLGIIFCYFYVPETKGHTLEEIEEHLRSRKHLGHLGVKEL